MQELINKIHLGDSLEFMKQIPDNSVDLIVTDPPYIVDTRPAGKSNSIKCGDVNKKLTSKYYEVKNYEQSRYTLEQIKDGFDIPKYFVEFNRVCKQFNAFIFCSNKQLPNLLFECGKYELNTTVLVWHKTNTVPFANGVWRSDLEYIVHTREKGATFQGDSSLKKKAYTSPTEISKYGHPTEKPIRLIENYIKIGSNDGDVVLDPFCGSGTTVNACINLKRKYIGIEIDENYYKISCDREERAKGNVGLFA